MRTADPGSIDSDISFYDQFEIDSVDCLNIMMTLEAEPALSIPEADDPNLSSLNGCVHDLQPALAEKARKTAAGSP